MFSKKLLVLALFPFISAVPAFSAEAPAAQASQQRAEPISELPASGFPATWLQGTPVTQWEKDKVYIFEFWATWCGPCLSAIPHLESIHKEITARRLNVQLIGVNIKDRQTPEKLKEFLAKRRVVPSYTIAVDTERNTDKNWILPRKIMGIPHALAVKNGTVIWSGHPSRLNTAFIEKMTRPDFSSGEQPAKAQTAIRQPLHVRLTRIRQAFSQRNDATAEKELQALLNDETVPESTKLSALAEPCFSALNRGEFSKMNICLRRKAEAFPKHSGNLYDVANFILSTDDIPESERDFALAEECLKSALTLERNNTHFRKNTFRLLAQIYAARGEREAQINALNACWNATAEYAWLLQLKDKLNADTNAQKALELYNTLEQGIAELPADFTGTTASDEKTPPDLPVPVFEKSSHPESLHMVKFLQSAEWLQGCAPENLPANGIVLVTFWEPSAPGPAGLLSRRPAEWLDEKIRGFEKMVSTFIVAVDSRAGRARKVLTFPRNRTEFPVCAVSEKALTAAFPNAIDPHHLPTVVVLRDGKTLWKGSPQEIPRKLIEDAVRPDYDHEKATAKREAEKICYRKAAKQIREIRLLAETGKYAEAEAAISALQSKLKPFPTLYMRAAEILARIARTRGNLKAAGEICASVIREYPATDYIAEMQLNLLSTDAELRAANLPVMILAYHNIIASGNPYASVYRTLISQIHAESGDFENAVYAAFAARNSAKEWQNLQNARNGNF